MHLSQSSFGHLVNAIIDKDTRKVLEYRHLIQREKFRKVWTNAFTKELGCLTQGIDGKVEGTDTMFFLPYEDIPKDRCTNVTYGKIVVDYRPQKDNSY